VKHQHCSFTDGKQYCVTGCLSIRPPNCDINSCFVERWRLEGVAM